MTYRRGDVVWVLTFPFTDLTATKKRPALIISNDAVNHTGDYILMMITSKIKTDSLSIEVNDSDYSESPLGIDSAVRVIRFSHFMKA